MFGSLSSGPPAPTNEALSGAMTLLQLAIDPAGTKARIDELAAATAAFNAARDEAVAAQAQAKTEAAALGDLIAREKKLTADQKAVSQSQTAAAVAASALATREQAATKREAELNKRDADLARREKALADKVASYRQALA
jgi:hypothetical protein